MEIAVFGKTFPNHGYCNPAATRAILPVAASLDDLAVEDEPRAEVGHGEPEPQDAFLDDAPKTDDGRNERSRRGRMQHRFRGGYNQRHQHERHDYGRQQKQERLHR